MMVQEKLKNYIRKLGLIPDKNELVTYVNNFIEDMEKGLKGADSSLKMIPSYLDIGNINKSQSCLVIDAGGTNLRVSTLHINDKGQYEFETFRKTVLPGVEKEYSKKDFFEYMYNFIEQDLKDHKKIGFCFSYPMEKFPNKDGKLIRWTKEIKAPEVVGSMIGASLMDIIEANTSIKRKAVLLNDTVASLFSGLSNYNQRDYVNHIGLIVGTGCNAAYVEDKNNIEKIKTDNEKYSQQVINIESGNFNKLKITEIDKLLNEETQDPYQQVLEKMVSGRYLGKLIYYLTSLIVKDNVVQGMEGILDLLKNADTQDISEWIYYGNNCDNEFGKKLQALNPTKDQTEALSIIIHSVINRASMFVAVKLASLIHKRNKGILIHKPTVIVAEGAVIESLPGFKNLLQTHLNNILRDFGDYYYDIIHINKANIIGSGISAIINIED